MAIFVHFTPSFQRQDKTFPWYYYLTAVLVYSLHQIFLYCMFVSQMAFFAKISDPKIGGTYMTLLNTLSNIGRKSKTNLSNDCRDVFFFLLLGSVWISTSVLFAADYLTWKRCSSNNDRCDTIYDQKRCETSGGVCRVSIDAYYIEVAISTIVGILWYLWKYRAVKQLQNLPISEWQVRRNRHKSELMEEDEEDEDFASLITTA